MRYRHLPQALLCAALLLAALAVTSCGEDRERTPGEVEGTWALAEDSAGAVILRVQGNDLDVFTENRIGGCYSRVDYQIIDPRGIDFRITNGQDTLTIEMQRDGEVLRVAAFDREAEYVPASFDPESLPVCVPPEPSADCAVLPMLTVGSEVADSLDEGDARTYLGTRYELYALQFGDSIDLIVSMSSSDVDSYLSLHDSTGSFIEANDDRSSRTLDAELRPALGAACYILMATTASADELGEFELEVAVPSSDSD